MEKPMEIALRHVPALVDDTDLVAECGRPDFTRIHQQLTPIDGNDLAKQAFLTGAADLMRRREAQAAMVVMERVAGIDTELKRYLPKFETWFADKFDWFLEWAGKIAAVRSSERRLVDEARKACSARIGAFQAGINLLEREEQARVEAVARMRAEQERQEEAERLRQEAARAQADGQAQLASAKLAEVDEVLSAPPPPVVVAVPQSQARLAGVSATTWYEQVIEKPGQFLAWVAGQALSVRPGAKPNQWIISATGCQIGVSLAQSKGSSMALPGCRVIPRTGTSNRRAL